jgi:hypothetical protein
MQANKILLFIAFLPYLAIAGYDGWLHEKARKVPLIEQASHAVMGLCVALLIWSVFFDHTAWTVPTLAVFALTACIDELGFHGKLHPREKHLHYYGYACFAVFAALALWFTP